MLIDDMDFAEDEAFLIKPNGTRIKIMAEIQTRTAYISDIETPIQIGDLLEGHAAKIGELRADFLRPTWRQVTFPSVKLRFIRGKVQLA